MGTRSVIGVYTSEADREWKGRYVHWDGYPSGVGAALHENLHQHFAGVVKELLEVVLAEKIGWSAIVGKNLKLPPIWAEGSSNWTEDDPRHQQPQSYTARGEALESDEDQAEGRWVHSSEDSWCEWAYIFQPDLTSTKMDIYKHRANDWTLRGSVDLADDEIDFEQIENS